MAKSETINLDINTKDGVKNVETLQKEIDTLNEKIANTEKNSKGSVGGLKRMGKAIGSLTKFAGGLFILQKAFEFIKDAVMSNQTAVDGIKVAFETAQIVFNQVADAVFSNTENFDALGRIMGNLITIALTPLKLAFQAIKGAVLSVQLIWEKSFFGGGDEEKIASLTEELNKVGSEIWDIGATAVNSAGEIVSDFGEAVTEVGNIANEVTKAVSDESIKAATEQAKTNIQLKKSAEIARVANQGLIEQYDREAEQLRQIRDNDLKNIEDRITANNDLKAKLEEQKEKMLENAQAILDAAEAQAELTGKDEDALAVQEAKNELKAVEAQIEGFMSEQESNRVSLLKEKMELELSNDEATAIRQNNERNFNAEMEQSEVLRIQMMIDNLKKERVIEEERLLMKRDAYERGTQAWQDANNQLLDYKQQSDQTELKLGKDLGNAKLSQTKQTLGALATIVGSSSKFGKGIAIAQAVMDTYAGADKALASAPPPYNFIQAAAVIATGLANVKNILKTEPPKPPANLGARDAGKVNVNIPAPPSFSVVGSSGISQLAEVITEQDTPPVQAFVVANDITSAQSLDRNIVSGASLG